MYKNDVATIHSVYMW